MALSAGARLGSYEITGTLGAGGMGEVYRALDTRLDRIVAIKTLPSHLAHDSEFRRRFEREARTLSSISHPNICTLYDIGEHAGVSFLVMEYLEGETLATRLRQGPLPIRELLAIGVETANALGQAHHKGVVHRDLKPANIMLTRNGAKLLDFGLARDISTAVAVAATPSEPTQLGAITMRGTIVGTFQYMSPEQLHGREADARSDVFAYGAVLYEMATGRAPFSGDSQASIIAAVLERAPSPAHDLRHSLPPSLEALIHRCLEKDPGCRWQCASDLASELSRIAHNPERRRTLPQARRIGLGERFAWTAVCLLLLSALLFAVHMVRSNYPALPIRASVLPPEGVRFAFIGDVGGPVVISPDARFLAFAATGSDGVNHLFLRPLSASRAREIQGTEHASFPFWSPDSHSLGFFADRKLKRVEVSGGAPVTICAVGDSRGGAWGRGTILFAPHWRGELFQVPDTGGTIHPVTRLDEALHTTHRWPFFLPDGKHFLYVAANHTQSSEGADIYLSKVGGGINKLLLHTQGNAVFANGYVLFVNGTELLARPLDTGTAEFRGEAVALAEDVLYDPGIWRGIFAASDTGVLTYQPGGVASDMSQLQWLDRTGRVIANLGERHAQFSVRLSHNSHYAVVEDSSAGSGPDAWIINTASGERRRLTFSGDVAAPVWSNDDRWVAYTRNGRQQGIYRKLVNGDGNEEMLLSTSSASIVTDWSPDGSYMLLVLDSGSSKTGRDLWLLPLSDEHKPRPLLQTRADESEGQISPDGHWIAFTSNESGRTEVYVAPFPTIARKWQISNSGGFSPKWRGDGKELFFLTPDYSMTSAEVNFKNGQFEVVNTSTMFVAGLRAILRGTAYDAAANGRSFLINSPDREQSKPVTLIQNWLAEIGSR
jgi:eukaryotic-like serine/threonine-protein kinase